MNVLTVPEWMKRNTEPAVPALPKNLPDDLPDEVKEWGAKFISQRQEIAFLRSENDQLQRDLKVASERVRMLESELNFIRDARDNLVRHDATMVTGLHHIKLMIVDLEARARDNAYAPPGSGQGDHSQNGDDLAAGVADLAKKLAPDGGGDA